MYVCIGLVCALSCECVRKSEEIFVVLDQEGFPCLSTFSATWFFTVMKTMQAPSISYLASRVPYEVWR